MLQVLRKAATGAEDLGHLQLVKTRPAAVAGPEGKATTAEASRLPDLRNHSSGVSWSDDLEPLQAPPLAISGDEDKPDPPPAGLPALSH